ncbi:hypothetical protein VNO80_25154 [Phaseolus coccineus]|uniref:Uncharacterized protein n=1 Tax=Phaseolus coccineus TaxID=3886 RepID=A0AAN9LTS2_PHACN
MIWYDPEGLISDMDDASSNVGSMVGCRPDLVIYVEGVVQALLINLVAHASPAKGMVVGINDDFRVRNGLLNRDLRMGMEGRCSCGCWDKRDFSRWKKMVFWVRYSMWSRMRVGVGWMELFLASMVVWRF